jgi:hypothetical protein
VRSVVRIDQLLTEQLEVMEVRLCAILSARRVQATFVDQLLVIYDAYRLMDCSIIALCGPSSLNAVTRAEIGFVL